MATASDRASWQKTVLDDEGRPVAGVRITIENESGGGLATLYTDRLGTVNAGNPVFTDARGKVLVYLVAGSYRITAENGGDTDTLRHVAIGTAAEADLDPDASMIADSLARIPPQQATKTAIDAVAAVAASSATALDLVTAQVESLQTVVGANQAEAKSFPSFRNLALNGAFKVDNDNAGALVTVNNTNSNRLTDMWFGAAEAVPAGAFTAQQVSMPDNSNELGLRVTTLTVDSSLTGTERYIIGTRFEGYYVDHLGCGTPYAKYATLSFDVIASHPGTYCCNITDSVNARSYVMEYTINQANVRERKSLTYRNDTLPGSNHAFGPNVGLAIGWCFGAGSGRQGAANIWLDGNVRATTNQFSMIGVNNAYWYITNVQLEVGQVATEPEIRPYGLEELLLQRFHPYFRAGTAGYIGMGWASAAGAASLILPFKVPCRVAPTAIEITASQWSSRNAAGGTVAFTGAALDAAGSTRDVAKIDFTGASGFTAGHAVPILSNTVAATMKFTGAAL